MKINRVFISVSTLSGEYRFDESFSNRLNIITSYENTVGKSTIGEAILFCLGFEEILGNKNEKAVKPVLRSKIMKEKGQEAEIVVQSDIFTEIEYDSKVLTLKRSPTHNSRSSKLISVYEGHIDAVHEGKVDAVDYYVHDAGAAKKRRGFHSMLTKFLNIKLPEVTNYDGDDTYLYIQTIVSCFYIEQKQGWRAILATLPTYYGIKDLKRRVLEYVMGLNVFENEKEYFKLKSDLSRVDSKWSQNYIYISNLIRKIDGLSIRNIEDKPMVLKEEGPSLIVNYNDKDITLDDFKEDIVTFINKLKNKEEPIVKNQSKALIRELKELDSLLFKFELEHQENGFALNVEEDQLKTIKNRIVSIGNEVSAYRELYKLKKMGSEEKLKISEALCPTCGQKINGLLFDQTLELNVMSIEDSLVHLNNEKKMLEYSLESQESIVDKLIDMNNKLDNRLDEIRSRIRTIKSDLVSNNNAVSESHLQKIIELQMKYEKICDVEKEIKIVYEQMKRSSSKWIELKSKFGKLPKDFISSEDELKLKYLKNEFKKILGLIKFESTNIYDIDINNHSYMPIVSGFDLYADSSASDTIRIIWAYIIALQKVSLKYGNNIGFLVLDEPAQQNTDLSSSKQLLKQLIELSEVQQVFMFYKLESKESDQELFAGIDKSVFKRIHSDKHFITLISTSKEINDKNYKD